MRTALRHKWKTLLVSTAALLACLSLIPLIGVELMPETDEGEIALNVELPVGTPIEITMETMKAVEKRARSVLREGELLHITTVAGPESAWRAVSANQGSMEITLVPVKG